MGKIEMKLIENKKARKNTFFRRKNSLEKKAKELSILCDVKILLIIYELGKQKPEVWTGNNGEAAEIIDKFKQQRRARGCGRGAKKACATDPYASEKKGFLEKFAMSDLKNMINHLTADELRMLCSELDAKIAAVSEVIESKQAVAEEEEPRSPNMSSDGQRTGRPLNKEKGKEVIIHQEPVHTRQEDQIFREEVVMLPQQPVHTQDDQSFETLPYDPTFMGSPMMMMMNGMSNNPEFDGGSTSTDVPYNPIPVHYVHPSWMQLAYMNSDSSAGYYEPNTYQYHTPPGFYYPLIPVPGFPTQMNQ